MISGYFKVTAYRGSYSVKETFHFFDVDDGVAALVAYRDACASAIDMRGTVSAWRLPRASGPWSGCRVIGPSAGAVGALRLVN